MNNANTVSRKLGGLVQYDLGVFKSHVRNYDTPEGKSQTLRIAYVTPEKLDALAEKYMLVKDEKPVGDMDKNITLYIMPDDKINSQLASLDCDEVVTIWADKHATSY